MTPCPVCGSQHQDLLYAVDSLTSAVRLTEELDDDTVEPVRREIETIWGTDSCAVVRCAQCTLVYADPFRAATQELYSLEYAAEACYDEWKWEFERTAVALRGLGATAELRDYALLDIGAGTGGFVARVQAEMPACRQALCVEYSAFGCGAITRRGIACVHGGLLDIDVATHRQAFDVLCLFQVLEHMEDPDGVFARLTQLAAKRGHLFIGVPNGLQRALFDAAGFHEDMPPVHIGRWSRQSLEVVATRHGWRVVEDEVEPEGYLSLVQRLVYLYSRESPAVRSLGRVRARPLRRALRGVVVSMFLLAHVRTLARLRGRGLGTAYWVHLTRGEPLGST